jgi:hypothetical protein
MNKTNNISNHNKIVVLHLANKFPNEFLKNAYEYKNLVGEQFLSAAIDRAKSILEKATKIKEQSTNMNRQYYFDVDGKQEPNETAMVAYLLDCGALFIGSESIEKTSGLCISINDYFGPGADSEKIEPHEISKLFELYRQKGFEGICEFVANKRGIPNVCWRESKSIEFNPEQFTKTVTQYANSF